MPSAHEVREDLAEPSRQLRSQAPDMVESYGTMTRAVMTDGALPAHREFSE